MRFYPTPLILLPYPTLPLLYPIYPKIVDVFLMHTVCSSTQAFQKELGSYQRSVDAATASGNHLVAEVLDDPTVTQQDLGEVNEMWEEVCVKSVQKQERLNKAQEVSNFIVLLLHIV